MVRRRFIRINIHVSYYRGRDYSLPFSYVRQWDSRSHNHSPNFCRILKCRAGSEFPDLSGKNILPFNPHNDRTFENTSKMYVRSRASSPCERARNPTKHHFRGRRMFLRLSRKYKDRQVTRPDGSGPQDLTKRNLLHPFKLRQFLASLKEKL